MIFKQGSIRIGSKNKGENQEQSHWNRLSVKRPKKNSEQYILILSFFNNAIIFKHGINSKKHGVKYNKNLTTNAKHLLPMKHKAFFFSFSNCLMLLNVLRVPFCYSLSHLWNITAQLVERIIIVNWRQMV